MGFLVFVLVSLGLVMSRPSPQYPVYGVYLQPFSLPPRHPAIFAPQPPLTRAAPAVSPLIHNTITYRVDPDAQPDDALEVAQFHSQDVAGRVVFGFNTPDQSRMEARALDGSVRGSYSYLDPTGKTVKMHYWDDGTGFHTAGNNLPVNFFSPPGYTPEVQAARERHFQLYREALAAALAVGPEGSEAEQPQYPDSSAVEVESAEAADQTADDTRVQAQETDEASMPSADYDSDSDAVQVDTSDYTFLRAGSEPEANRKQVAEVTDLTLDTGSNLAIARTGSDGYQYLVPVATPPHGHYESLHATLYGAIPVAAVHDAQVSPAQRDNLADHQVTDLTLDTGSNLAIARTGSDGYQYLVPVATPPHGHYESLHATLYGAIPVAAVHDAQVSPAQRDNLADHQVKPLLLQTGLARSS